jgi:hypothetical protein
VSTNAQDPPRPLPDRPNLRHLKNQAKDLFKAGAAETITEAQFKIACLYGFASWPKLKAHVDSLEELGQLKQAIDTNDAESVKNPPCPQSRAASRSAWLFQKRTPHLGRGMPCALGAAEFRETIHSQVDD